jgi:hypothetical protein
VRLGRVPTLLCAAALLLAAPGPALAKVEIRRIAFNPRGADSGTNEHVNREFIYLVNTGPRARGLRGWKIHDRGRENVYRFRGVRLGPGDTLTLRSGRGDDGAGVCDGDCPVFYYLHWNLRNYVWGNRGDVATLRNRSGRLVDRCRYGVEARSPKRC